MKPAPSGENVRYSYVLRTWRTADQGRVARNSVCAFVVFASCGKISAVTCTLPTRVL